MAFTKLAGLSLLVTLSFRTLLILGESVFISEIGKSGELKVSDKRVNNFGVPMEMPYDTSFWPSRGRRGRRPESDSCYTSDRSFVFAKQTLRCQTPTAHPGRPSRKWSLADTEFNSLGELDDHLLPGYDKMGTTCCDLPPAPSRGTLINRLPDLVLANAPLAPKRFDGPNKKRKHLGPLRLLLYGNGVYWEPENPYGEKKKKHDVFWVARGKKNFYRK